MIDSQDAEGIERATLAAVPPQRQETFGEWLLAYDDGTVGRCHSAVPLRHAPPVPGTLDEIERRYAGAGLPPILRIPEHPAFDAFRSELTDRAYVRSTPTSVQVAQLPARGGADTIHVRVSDTPDARWEDTFLGEDGDPVDASSRLAILRRGAHSIFASVDAADRVAAVGFACLSHGWCGIHGMRTASAFRHQGHASAILARLAEVARERGITRWFLQVEETNAAALRLYKRHGFEPAWTYAYWRPAQ